MLVCGTARQSYSAMRLHQITLACARFAPLSSCDLCTVHNACSRPVSLHIYATLVTRGAPHSTQAPLHYSRFLDEGQRMYGRQHMGLMHTFSRGCTLNKQDLARRVTIKSFCLGLAGRKFILQWINYQPKCSPSAASHQPTLRFWSAKTCL